MITRGINWVAARHKDDAVLRPAHDRYSYFEFKTADDRRPYLSMFYYHPIKFHQIEVDYSFIHHNVVSHLSYLLHAEF